MSKLKKTSGVIGCLVGSVLAVVVELVGEYVAEDYLVRGGHVRMNGGLEFVYSSVHYVDE